MGRRWIGLCAALALGLVVWALHVRRAEAEEHVRQVEALEAAVASLGEGQLEQHRDLAKWYNHQLGQDASVLEGAYDGILNLGNGMMALLEVPELNLRRAIFHGEAGLVGHDPATPLPIGGRGNHTVLTLREDSPWAAGQTVYIDILGQRLTYQVESVQVMPAGWSVERPTEAGQDLLTLVHDRGHTRTLVRCVRSADLTVRPLGSEKPGGFLLAVLVIPVLIPALGRRRGCAKREQTPRICGFYRKNSEKSKLS